MYGYHLDKNNKIHNNVAVVRVSKMLYHIAYTVRVCIYITYVNGGGVHLSYERL